MSILENVRVCVSNTARLAVRQTKKVAAMGRVKLAINAEQDKIKKAEIEIGRLFYRDYEAGTPVAMEDYQIWCDKIADAKEQVAKLDSELLRVRSDEAEEPAAEAENAEETEEILLDEEPAAKTEDVFEIVPEEPTVGTLYVDITDYEG